MADSRARGERPPNPVVRHGKVPDPTTVSPVQGARPAPPRPGAGTPPREWPGPVLRRLRDPLPDGYAPRTGRRGRSRTDPGPRPAGRGPRTVGGTAAAGAAGAGSAAGAAPAARAARTGPPPPPGATVPVDAVLAGGPPPDVDPDLRDTFDDDVTPESVQPLQGPEPGPLSAVRRKLGRSLVPGEHILVAQTRHPVVLAEPVLSSLFVLLGIAGVSPYLGALDIARNALMVVWVVLALRALWAWLQWSNDYFVVTDRRLIRLHGLLDVQRDMMPLTKVTDMAFQRPFWGRPFNYGRFVLESAGADQALRVISYVRDPENVDALIGRQVFARAPYGSGGGPGR